MATPPSKPPRNQRAATVPPKRGRVKVQIFKSLAGTVSHVASKAREALSKIRGSGGAASDGSTSTSSTTSSPASAYASDGYGNLA